MMPRRVYWAPITAQRYLDLHEVGGMDDFFSSDYTDEILSDRLGHIGTGCANLQHMLVACSGQDEYVPKHVNEEQPAHLNRLVRAMQSSSSDGDDGGTGTKVHGLLLPTGNHNLSQGDSDAQVFVDKLQELLSSSS